MNLIYVLDQSKNRSIMDKTYFNESHLPGKKKKNSYSSRDFLTVNLLPN